ncbi:MULTISPECIES: phosphate acetyltransferase [unclassified Campylobacter]|uniref:phosphate acetyltransferase n=1 Tax=unclassified Campylobacter TaxID=2593542 RepID=UPI0022EA0BDE|nr:MULTISPECIES: phosphate acetyltransferase [unclassified Campylobacter]MDA3056713.1 phosphate acetyltransferase [Campylobacter sp. CN_NA1]MDA3066093.1 phosphate acetyltransferase [Campylobacter sp. CN_NE4]MDA3069046.1 phosphate acetyltransferase [Campylobacter sp. CN_NE3]MDA3083373.1 phosphate acetyltransferase [Campylobacter sp. CN_EL2]MDA3084860.1 phosphate acetyltransferase [Campylobacter sp. CN_NE1]
MNGIYILTFSKAILPKISQIFGSKFKNIKIFEPIGDGEFSCFDEKSAFELLAKGEKSKFIKTIISKFDEMRKNGDFIIVNGFFDLKMFNKTNLNLELSKHLNLQILACFEDEKEADFFKNLAKIANAQNSLNLIKENFVFDSGEKFALNEITNESKFFDLLEAKMPNMVTPLRFENDLYAKAASNLKSVVLPESDDERILKAAHIINESKAVKIVLLGDENEINSKAKNLGLNLDGIRIINPANNEYSDEFANTLYELRKAKGMELEKAKALVKDRTYFGTMLVYTGICDAMVSGASTTTAETIRPALQTIKMKPGVSTVSGSFLMCMDSEVYLFADCAITPNPTAEQLAGIVVSSAATASAFGIDPKIAMLSYSTGSSGSGEDVEFVINATNLAKELAPNLDIEGPIQFDAAVDKIVAAKKLPNSKVAGSANVFIFPNLNCGNICYKAVQRTSGAVAIGPILQGLKKPVNDLSRGCLVEDVVNTILISAIQAGEN